MKKWMTLLCIGLLVAGTMTYAEPVKEKDVSKDKSDQVAIWQAKAEAMGMTLEELKMATIEKYEAMAAAKGMTLEELKKHMAEKEKAFYAKAKELGISPQELKAQMLKKQKDPEYKK